MLDQITPLILTYNEAPNIRRTMGKLLWAARIVVVDSGSTDDTLKILAEYPQADVIQNPFSDFATQCNFGLMQVQTPWVLSLDADYELSDKLVEEMARLSPLAATDGYRASFIYRIHGQALRGSLYPPRVVLYRKQGARYYNEGHGHRVTVPGAICNLASPIYHDDRKTLAHWIRSQQRYADDEARYLIETPAPKLKRGDRVRRMGWPAPLGILFYVLFVKGCILDGWAGWRYAMERLVAEALIALALAERRLQVPANRDRGN